MTDLRITTSEQPLPQVTLEGRIDTNTSHELEAALEPVLDAEPAALLVDLSGIDYISSAGLRVVLMATRKMQPRGARLLLCGMNDHVKEVFDIAGFSRLLEIHASSEKALTALGLGAGVDLPTDALMKVYGVNVASKRAPTGLVAALASVYRLPAPSAELATVASDESGNDAAAGADTKPWWRELIDSVKRQVSALRRR